MTVSPSTPSTGCGSTAATGSGTPVPVSSRSAVTWTPPAARGRAPRRLSDEADGDHAALPDLVRDGGGARLPLCRPRDGHPCPRSRPLLRLPRLALPGGGGGYRRRAGVDHVGAVPGCRGGPDAAFFSLRGGPCRRPPPP